jgi:Cysteine-rich secretory protein family
MRRRLFAISFASLLGMTTTHTAYGQIECHGAQILTQKSCAGDGLEPKEIRFYEMINYYRIDRGLPPIAQSPSLTLVANRHVRDLEENVGFLTPAWSNCAYDPGNQNTWQCMANAPQRLCTTYPGKGYEIALANAYKILPDTALAEFSRSNYYNASLLNPEWNALGVGTYKGYLVLWFGKEPDALPPTKLPSLPDLGQGQAVDNNHQPTATLATFLGGASLGLRPYENRQMVNSYDVINIRGTFLADSNHVGKTADLVVYAAFQIPNSPTPVFYMMDEKGKIQPWNQKNTSLVPFRKDVILPKVQDLKLYSGQFSTPLRLQIYFGYRLPEGTVVLNKQPIEVTVK